MALPARSNHEIRPLPSATATSPKALAATSAGAVMCGRARPLIPMLRTKPPVLVNSWTRSLPASATSTWPLGWTARARGKTNLPLPWPCVPQVRTRRRRRSSCDDAVQVVVGDVRAAVGVEGHVVGEAQADARLGRGRRDKAPGGRQLDDAVVAVVGHQDPRALDRKPLGHLQLALAEDLGVLAGEREALHAVVGGVGHVDVVTRDRDPAAGRRRRVAARARVELAEPGPRPPKQRTEAPAASKTWTSCWSVSKT